MTRFRSLAALAGLALAACTSAGPPATAPGPQNPATLAEARQASRQRRVPILLDFWKHG